MSSNRHLALPLRTLGLVMLVFPLAQVAITSWPFQPAHFQWRFGVAGLLIDGMFFGLLGLVLILTAALLEENARTVRILAWVSMIGAVLTVIMLPFFAMDALQVRATVPPQMRPAFERAIISSILRDLAGIIVLATLAIGARRARREYAPPRANAPDGMIVGRQTRVIRASEPE